MGVSVLLRFVISSNEVCNTAYALYRIHEQNSIFKDTKMTPKEMKYKNIRKLICFIVAGPCANRFETSPFQTKLVSSANSAQNGSLSRYFLFYKYHYNLSWFVTIFSFEDEKEFLTYSDKLKLCLDHRITNISNFPYYMIYTAWKWLVAILGQWRAGSDRAFCVVWSGPSLSAYRITDNISTNR